ncbi:MAG: hypothetical protein OXG46_06960 [Chloroflexi bacterium]|nr:hypothetical protein [Chloroflexota bacterium]MCY3936830.1 hypothetical protein [Chloroflexota bacterium]
MEVVKSLIALQDSGGVDLAITTRVDQDIPNMPLSARIRELPEVGIQRIGAPFRLGISKLGGPDVLASRHFGEIGDSVNAELDRNGVSECNRPDSRDWDHLQGHDSAGRDYFLTWDRGILGIATQLKAGLGIIVMEPEEFLRRLADSPRED